MTEKNLERRKILDPAVADLISGLEQKQTWAQLPRRERRKKAREQAKIISRREQRATYDLPPQVRQQIKEMAENERVPASQIVTLALTRFLSAHSLGEIDLSQYKQPSRSPRYDWNLVLPEAARTAAAPTRKQKP